LANDRPTKDREVAFYTTGSTTMFDRIASEWLDEGSVNSKHIVLGEKNL